MTPLDPGEIQRLYAACDETGEGRRDYVLLVVLLNGGLDEEELSRLRTTHVDFERRWLWVVQGIRRPRFVPLSSRLATALQGWLRHPTHAPRRYVFGRLPSGRRQQSRRAVAGLIRAIGRRADVELSVARAHATLARYLFDLSDEAATIRSAVPAFKRHNVQLPLENLPPFSVTTPSSDLLLASKGFVPGPWDFVQVPAETEAVAYGRRLLEAVGAAL